VLASMGQTPHTDLDYNALTLAELKHALSTGGAVVTK